MGYFDDYHDYRLNYEVSEDEEWEARNPEYDSGKKGGGDVETARKARRSRGRRAIGSLKPSKYALPCARCGETATVYGKTEHCRPCVFARREDMKAARQAAYERRKAAGFRTAPEVDQRIREWQQRERRSKYFIRWDDGDPMTPLRLAMQVMHRNAFEMMLCDRGVGQYADIGDFEPGSWSDWGIESRLVIEAREHGIDADWVIHEAYAEVERWAYTGEGTGRALLASAYCKWVLDTADLSDCGECRSCVYDGYCEVAGIWALRVDRVNEYPKLAAEREAAYLEELKRYAAEEAAKRRERIDAANARREADRKARVLAKKSRQIA